MSLLRESTADGLRRQKYRCSVCFHFCWGVLPCSGQDRPKTALRASEIAPTRPRRLPRGFQD
eukprot:9037512-Pyramimonas_sp.AAC.1